MISRIRLLPLTPEVPLAELEVLGSEAVFACDCYVSGIENGMEVPGGYQLGRVTNVDHHAPTTRMQQVISSANLALEHVSRSGPWTQALLWRLPTRTATVFSVAALSAAD